MDKNFMLEAALKAQQWELAKGHLRALIALQGSYASTVSSERWKDLEERVEAFITEVEDHALQE